MVSRRGTGRGGPQTLPGSHAFEDLPKRRTGQTTAEGADGSSACPGDSSHERGDAGASSHPWDIQQADKSIRVRNAGEKLRPLPRFSPERPHASGWATAGVPLVFSNGVREPAWLAGGRGSGFLPSVPHAPFGETDKRNERRASAEVKRGR